MKRRTFTPEPRPHHSGAAEAKIAELTAENAFMRELLDVQPSYDVVCRRAEELEKHAAEVHKLLGGRDSHEDGVRNLQCALNSLHEIMQASRENSEENARLEAKLVDAVPLDAESNQFRVTEWVREVFDEATASNAPERALRAAEEVIELTQACGVDREAVHRLVDYVFGRPVGEPAKEVAGSLVTIYAAAHALGVDAQKEFETEIMRVWEPEVIERVRRRQQEKREATVTADTCGCGKPSIFPNGWCGSSCHAAGLRGYTDHG